MDITAVMNSYSFGWQASSEEASIKMNITQIGFEDMDWI
jgi:hypothetical protein